MKYSMPFNEFRIPGTCHGINGPIRTATNTALKAITVRYGANAIAITPDGKTAYVLIASGYVVPINTTNTAWKTIRVTGYLVNIAITSTARRPPYVLNDVFEPGTEPGTVIPLDRHRHRRQGDHGRERPRRHRIHAITTRRAGPRPAMGLPRPPPWPFVTSPPGQLVVARR